jgi:hypothetical protein
MLYQVTFVHPIAGPCPDATQTVELPAVLPTDHKALGKLLRRAGLLMSGQRVNEAKPYGGNRFVVWPQRVPGGMFSMTFKPMWVVEHEAQPEWHLYAPGSMLRAESSPRGVAGRYHAVQRYEVLPAGQAPNTTPGEGYDVVMHTGVHTTSRRCKRAYINAELRVVMVFDRDTLRDEVIRNSWERVPAELQVRT